jgi:hypothetical protein
MAKKVLLGTIVGAVVIFLASFVWHEFLPFAEAGVRNLPHDDVLTAAMRLGISEPGWYMFPTMDPAKQNDPVEMKKYAEKFRRGPTGVLIYSPGGAEFNFPMLLAKQFLYGLFAALVMSLLLAISAGSLPGYGQRVLFVALVAVFPGLVADLPYWSWYGFPGSFTASHFCEVLVTWTVTGLALAALVKPSKA